MKRLIIVAVLMVGITAMAETKTPNISDLLGQMEKWEHSHAGDEAVLAGHQYVEKWGFHNWRTVVLTNSKLVIVVDGQWIFRRGDTVEVLGKDKVRIGGTKYKVLRKLILK